jgi:uncharacterized membrane protein
MPEIIPLGWFHTVCGILAIVIGAKSLATHKVIALSTKSGRLYLLLTLLTAVSSLGIYQHDGFNMAHILAILTLGGVAVGAVAERTQLFRQFSPYLQAVSYSATLLFHMIPAITDGLRRLPVGDPFIDSIEHPILGQFYLAFLVTYVVGTALQCRWLYQSAKNS